MSHHELQSAVRYQQAGRLEEAEAIYRRILVRQPDLAEAHYNLGTVLKRARRSKEAVEAFQRAITLRPDFAEAHNNLGNALRERYRPAEAIEAYQRALSLRGDFAEAWNNLGAAMKDVGNIDEALRCFDRAMAIEPDNPAPHGNRVYALHFHAAYGAAAILEEHRQWNRRHALCWRPQIPRHDNDPSPRRRLRVGYISPYFRQHCQTLFTTPLLSYHDHREFEIFCYSDVSAPDALTDRLRGFADAWRDISRHDDADAAALVREDKIDILVDLTLHMAANRLCVFARKPAPIQLTWLGYPATTGLDAMDYRLTDSYLDPPGSDVFYAERSIRLPDSFWCYDSAALGPTPSVGELPASRNGFVTFGSLNNFCKVTDGTLALWARIMLDAPNSRLVMLAPPGPHRQRVLDLFAASGTEAWRVEFVEFQPREKYLEVYQRIDLALDTLPYNGHTTSLDSLWMGVPVITVLGSTAVGRAGFSQLSKLVLPEFAARADGDAVELARHWSGNLSLLGELRATLRQRMRRSPLMDAPRFARNIESVYREIWQGWAKASRWRGSPTDRPRDSAYGR